MLVISPDYRLLLPGAGEKLLHTMVATEDIEEVEILKARFDTFDQEMNTNIGKVELVNQLSSQLLENEHPNSTDVTNREKQLNERFDSIKLLSLVDHDNW